MIKKSGWAILIIAAILLSYFLWFCLRPVKIIAVHEDGNYSDVLVDHFPVTVHGKISWWLENRDRLKSRYGIPEPSSSGSYTITFWLFGDGYMEEDKYDRLCFMEMKARKYCIEKNKTFTVDYSKNSGLFFTARNGYYRVTDSGKIIPRER